MRTKGKSPGIDGLDLDAYEADQSKQLYKVWNRMSSGSYRPAAVLEVSIPKQDGGKRKLGIPTVGNRVAQMVVKQYLEPRFEAIFTRSSYGYRPGRSAHQAVEAARRHCWQQAWVIDLDVKGFFDHLDHELLNRALDQHVPEAWCRWTSDDLVVVGTKINRLLEGWIAYFGKFSKHTLWPTLKAVNRRLIKWVKDTFKRKRRHAVAHQWLRMQAIANPQWFAHWKAGFLP